MTRGTNGTWAPARSRGLQSPYSRDQLAAMILYPILTAIFYLLAIVYLPSKELPPVLVIYSALVVVVVSCWVYVEMVDPSKPGGVPCWCMKLTQSNSRYCANCRKTVPGLDHHCLWLNTCIGTRNYFFFFLLAVCGTLQFAFQTLISILMLTYWLGPIRRVITDTVKNDIVYEVVMIIHILAAGAAMLGFGSLCIFHGYLQALGMGTYDWVLSKRDYGSSSPAPAPRRQAAPPAPTAVKKASVEMRPVVTNNGNITTTNTTTGAGAVGAAFPAVPSTSSTSSSVPLPPGADQSEGEDSAVFHSPAREDHHQAVVVGDADNGGDSHHVQGEDDPHYYHDAHDGHHEEGAPHQAITVTPERAPQPEGTTTLASGEVPKPPSLLGV